MITSNKDNLEYGNGEVVFEEGSDGKEIYLILNGKAEVSRNIAGKKEILAILEKDDFFGEMAAVTGDARSMTIKAIGDLHLIEFSLKEMLEYMQREPEILGHIFTSLVVRLRNTNGILRESALKALAIDEEENWEMSKPYLEKLNILVVDNHPNIVMVMKSMLSDEYNVFTSPDGKSAMQLMDIHDIALVIADYRMPGMTGVELLANVRETYPETIRIVLSGHVDQGVLMKAIRTVQAHEVLSKPWRNEELRFTIARWMEQYRKNRLFKERANQYIVLRRQLESANKLIEKLIQEKGAENAANSTRLSFWQRVASITNRKDIPSSAR